MTWTCSKKERIEIVGISLIVTTIAACCVFVYVSLENTGVDYKQTIHSRRHSRESGNRTQDCIPICTTEDCVLYAGALLKLLKPSENQCEDFYSLTCGEFLEDFGKDDDYWMADLLTKRIYIELKDLMDNMEVDPETASGKMKMVYDTCMDIRSSELEALSSGLQFLRELGIPSWPNVPPDFEFSKNSLAKAIGILAAYHEFSFISFTNHLVDGKPVYTASIHGDPLNRIYDRDLVYVIRRLMEYFGIKESFLQYSAFPLFKLSESVYGTKDCESGNLTDVYIDCSQIIADKWRFLCETLDTFVDVANVNHMMSKDHIVIPCGKSHYIENFFLTMEEVPDSIIARLVGFTFFLNHVQELNFQFQSIVRDNMAHFGAPSAFSQNRWVRCIQWIIRHMVHALGQEYTKKVLTEPVFLQAKDIVDECFMETKNIISEQKWLTDEEKTFLKKKISVTTSLDEDVNMYLNETLVNDYYKEFHPTSDSFLKNVLEYQRAFLFPDTEKTDLQRQKEPFSMNAFTAPNFIGIGLGHFQFPRYLPSQPRFLKFINIAAVVGHELGHVIELTLTDREINSSESRKTFEDKKLCLQNQYSNFTYESIGLNVDAEMTLFENIGDNFGVILVDRLLRKYAASGEEYSLPYLPYTTKQLAYFIMAEFHCSKTSKKEDQMSQRYSGYPPGRFRVTGMLQNSKEFSKAFNCPEGSYMNPSPKCRFLDDN